jgi:hypothetical protein
MTPVRASARVLLRHPPKQCRSVRSDRQRRRRIQAAGVVARDSRFPINQLVNEATVAPTAVLMNLTSMLPK